MQLKELYNDYKSVGYSTSEVEGYLNKLYSYPIYLMIMTIIGSILMLHIKNFDSKIFNIVAGILFSVIVYYINYFFGVLGDNGKLPIIGVGGISTPEQAVKKIEAGAHLIQLYTGIIYEGPGIVRKINKKLLNQEL